MKLNLDLKNIRFSSDILKLIGDIDEFKGAWKAYGNLAPERLTALKRVATIESVASSTRIEGSTLSDQEVAQVLNNLSTQSFKSRDEQEVAGYGFVMEEIFRSWEHMELTENLIKQLHGDLMRFSEKDTKHRGEYKKLENNVAAFENGRMVGIVFETASAFQTPFLMQELLDWYRLEIEQKNHHPLIIIAVFLATFLLIHPFQDGNGRLSRSLTTLMLMRSGYVYTPYSSLENVIEETKQTYYAALRLTQKTIPTESPQWEPWVLYFLRALKQQMRRLEKKIANEHLLQTIPELSVRILEVVKSLGNAKISDIEKLTQAHRSTIRIHINKLVEDGHLDRHGQRKGTYYTVKSS